MNEKNLKRIPEMMTVIGGILLLIMILLPFTSADKEYEEYLLKYKDNMYLEEINMTNEDVVNISLVEYWRIYLEAYNQGINEDVSITCMILIGLYVGMSLITLLISLDKKLKGIIVFDLLTMGIFQIIRCDMEDRGVVGYSYEWGIASYLTYVIGIIILVGAIWMIIMKKKEKLSKNENEQID
jgi:hypothetical protein